MEVVVSILSVCGFSGVILFFIKRYFDRRDQKEIASKEEQAELFKELKVCFATIRLLAYARLSDEIERLLTQGFATPVERHFLDEMYLNYKDHGWNGDMGERMEKVYALRTDKPSGDSKQE